MRYLLLLLVFPFFVTHAQEKSLSRNVSDEYVKEAISFLNTIKRKELNDPSFTLVDVPKYACFEYTVDDSVSFTKAEMDQIANEIKSPKVMNWRTILSTNIRFLESKFVSSHTKVIKNPTREVRRFEKYFGGCYTNFSAPIFLRAYTFCLMYVDQICAGGKSSGELQVFEKVEGVWKQLPSRCEWSE